MHGRPRRAPSQEEQEASAIKAAKLRSLQTQFIHFHHNKIYDNEALELSAKLLEANPEHYTAWNYRKLAVDRRLNQSETENNAESIKEILDEELRLVENALRSNYKSYGAWYHRKWVLSKGHSSTDRELRLLAKFQKADSRNFHAWNYRRFITALKNIPDEEELQYTTDMIYDNFSNYSAWHNRSALLIRLLKENVKGYSPKENVLTEELEFVRNALFTDPDDQSGWFYHLWLLDQTVKLTTLLVSSWPPHGSSLHLTRDGLLDNFILSPLAGSKSNARTLPLVLYFSEAVKNINPSTVKVECEGNLNTDLVWRPLSGNDIECAQAWLTYLNFPDRVQSLESYHVKVNISHSQGIVSLSGSVYCGAAAQLTFTVHVPPYNSEHIEMENEKRISWKEENFCTYETVSPESVLVNSSYQMRMPIDDEARNLDWNIQTLDNEIAHCRELLLSVNCKIGKLTLARLLMAREQLMSYNDSNAGNHYGEVLQFYNDLMELDPPHIRYYKDEYSSVLLRQLFSNQESLLERCHQYREPSSSIIYNYSCLRLNNLSLSRVGCVEKLLWVQILDLSCNQLRSIEGMEAMQLLSCLNLSKNFLCSFTALEPLRHLRSLKVLDISYNEIGAHSIDTRRYLCSSPLCHSSGSAWNIEQFSTDAVNATDYWEAFLVFKHLNLIQLDIAGNAVSDEKLKLLLPELMPSLKWLDGQKLR
nr:geranylgeranyl transferase type-2 subunit alpha 1-like [Ipomoea trifida]